MTMFWGGNSQSPSRGGGRKLSLLPTYAPGWIEETRQKAIKVYSIKSSRIQKTLINRLSDGTGRAGSKCVAGYA